MSKPVHRLMGETPMIVYVTKNGRPVSETVGSIYVKRNFPDIKDWKFSRNDHSFVAEEVSTPG